MSRKRDFAIGLSLDSDERGRGIELSKCQQIGCYRFPDLSDPPRCRIRGIEKGVLEAIGEVGMVVAGVGYSDVESVVIPIRVRFKEKEGLLCLSLL